MAASSGLAGTGAARALIVAVGLAPLLFGLAWTAAVLGYPTCSAACVVLLSATVVAAAGVVRGIDLLRPEYGTSVGIVAAVTAVALTLITALNGRQRRH